LNVGCFCCVSGANFVYIQEYYPMIRFTRGSLYGTIISVGILTAIVFVVEFGNQTMSALGQKEGTLPNLLLLGLIVSEV